jgi:hypothetical protein
MAYENFTCNALLENIRCFLWRTSCISFRLRNLASLLDRVCCFCCRSTTAFMVMVSIILWFQTVFWSGNRYSIFYFVKLKPYNSLILKISKISMISPLAIKPASSNLSTKIIVLHHHQKHPWKFTFFIENFGSDLFDSLY